MAVRSWRHEQVDHPDWAVAVGRNWKEFLPPTRSSGDAVQVASRVNGSRVGSSGSVPLEVSPWLASACSSRWLAARAESAQNQDFGSHRKPDQDRAFSTRQSLQKAHPRAGGEDWVRRFGRGVGSALGGCRPGLTQLSG